MEKCVPGTKQGRKQGKRNRPDRPNARPLICQAGERRRLFFSTKRPAALARSQAPIVYHTRVQVWRRLDTQHTCHGRWRANPTATVFSTPPGLCSEHTHEDDGGLSAHPHAPATAARHIARAFLAPRHRCSDAGSLWLPQCGLCNRLPLKRFQGLVSLA